MLEMSFYCRVFVVSLLGVEGCNIKRLGVRIVCLLSLSVLNSVYADVIVRMKLAQSVNAAKYINIRLFDTIAPKTVTNFLNYVNETTINGGNYKNSFIHRSSNNPPVLQGGGYSFDPSLNGGAFTFDFITGGYPGGFQQVTEDASIDNEFRLSNFRGTIAMAKKQGDINSATSQWFINLSDNSATLDVLESGFTVFGEVISNGMQVVDEIAAIPVYDKRDTHFGLADFPLVSYSGTDAIQQENLVRINNVEAVLNITADLDFGNIIIGDSVQLDITVENIRVDDPIRGSAITIENIADADLLESPFSIVSKAGDCSAITILIRTATCTLTIDFSPQIEADYEDTFNIEFTAPVELSSSSFSYSFKVKGRASDNFNADLTTAIAEFDSFPPVSPIYTNLHLLDIDFGEMQLGINETINFIIRNDGNTDLNVTSVELNGSQDFTISDNCLDLSPVAPSDFCLMPVHFLPTQAGLQSAIITIVSNDPDESPLLVTLSGNSRDDVDGVSSEMEDGAPNSGDNNVDGVLDKLQSNVVSIRGDNDTYVSFVADSGINFNSVVSRGVSQFSSLPDTIKLDLGVFSFSVEDFLSTRVELGILLPADAVVDSYYMYGPTPDNANPHWYNFSFDGETGVLPIGNAVFKSPLDNTEVSRTVLKLFFADGARGDADLLQNGSIVVSGSPVLSRNDSNSAGALVGVRLFVFLCLIVGIRRIFKPNT